MSLMVSPWVAVTDHLPEQGREVLVFMPRTDRDKPNLMAIASMTKYGWWPIGSFRKDDIAYWCDLPAPPTREVTPP